MSIEQAPSILIEIGVSAFAVGLLHRLQLLMDDPDSEGREQMERLRESRRLATQQHIEALKRMDAEGTPLFSPEFSRIEAALREDALRNAIGNSAPEQSKRHFTGESIETFRLEESGEVLPRLA